MTIGGEGLGTLGDVLGPVMDQLDATHSMRYPVIRTKLTAEREAIPREDRVYVYQRDGFRCTWCGSSTDLTLDHIKPWSAGGSDHVDNLRTLCWACNEHRSNFWHADDSWQPLPVTYYCIDCDLKFRRDYPNAQDLPTGPMAPSFCWWHRHAALGHPEKEAGNE